ncbi:magnesium transporter [Candidatus Planktophila versatilis]|jgi:magnesium transporter|uniref:magnesium and cobalt transport protein CorA n=1 Tax=Candidatus Planktophila versatilis TaxID=1884905 RepID=UPI000BAC5893|nr:magnesium and cobalt transport protein CorA [Candidatus Planktophila versatilis]ASY19192.1 magnesium transporter [Candidatus Planktophila versatilis]
MIVDYALYQNGVRYTQPSNLAELIQKARSDGGFVWLGLAEPTENEFNKIVGDFKFHPLAIEDAITAHQRPKFEEYPGVQALVLKTAFYEEKGSQISTGEIFCFIGEHFIVVVRHGNGAPLVNTRHHLESNPEQLAKGPYAVAHAILDHVIDCYIDISIELEADVLQVEHKVFGDTRESASQEIYLLKREVIEFRHAIDPLLSPLQQIASIGARNIPAELTPFFRDTLDHLSRASDAASGLDALLTSALQAEIAQVQLQQNSDMRKITSYVALASVPTMIAGIYGMNFDTMPELRWEFGYPAVIGSLLVITVVLYRKFKKSGWL